MPANTKVQPALELIKKDPSKVLGLTVGKHNITEPGQYVPRAGEFPGSLLLKIYQLPPFLSYPIAPQSINPPSDRLDRC